MPLVTWKAEYELGLPRMDDTHREFIDELNRLDATPNEEFLAGLDRLIEHTVAHFEQENRWIEASGIEEAPCHQDMHDEILGIARYVRGKVADGDFAIGRKLIAELVPWFDIHAATMDAALAKWIGETGFDIDKG
ncbi:MAG: cation-binding hemerythrin HHE [Rhodocyclaceae bacterium]|jgi:hemerythrin-like metal-binding protein|nr:cation-binding hemerythrin HHE [Rhodocyclaceae bacterium]